jgi:ankyrin repeat protein
VVKLLIEKGADVNIENDFENTLLIISIDKGYTEIAKFLIKKGADINAMEELHIKDTATASYILRKY